jgi:hypothetical protein
MAGSLLAELIGDYNVPVSTRKKLGEILVQAGVLSEAQLRAALTEQRRWGGPLGRILVEMKVISEEAMVQALSMQLNLPGVNLEQKEIDPAVIDLVPGELAEQLSAMPFAAQGKFLDVAMTDPTNLAAIDTLRTKTRMNVRPYLAGPRAMERAHAKHYGRGVAPIDVGAVGASHRQPVDFQAPSSPMLDIEGRPYEGFERAAAAPPGAAAVATRRGHGSIVEPLPLSPRELEAEKKIAALQERIERLEALVARDEDVLRKLLGLLVQKGLATREEIVERLK